MPPGSEKLLEEKNEERMREYLELLDKLRERDLDQLMRWNIFMILRLMRDREYLKASDKYVQICIGNAPWPIGVTSVGIHARSGRERISETTRISRPT